MKQHRLLLATVISSGLAGCGTETPTPNTSTDSSFDCEGNVCVVSGTITKDTTFTNDKEWLLRGGVFIGDDVDTTVLTIEPGTQIYGETSTRGMLVIRRNSKILAEGTADAPIVMTSSQPEGQRARGDWGGLIVNGNAPVNGCDESPCESYGEGGTGYYGGDNADDDSGVLRYVRVEFAGQLISPDNELNGIAFQGVGRNTVVDYIQVHMGADDGVEFFGGTVNAKHILVTGVGDDSIDWTDGWQGRLQFAIAQQYEDAGDNGIEADNNGDDNTAAPRSHPVLSNVTLIGSPESSKSDLGILLREGTAANLHNFVVQGFNEACLDIDHDETFSVALDADGNLTGDLTIENSIFDCAKNFDDNADESDEPITIQAFFELNDGNATANPALVSPYETDFGMTAESPARTGGVVPSDSFFEQVDYKGAIAPGLDWTQGWTVSYRN